MKQTQYRLRSVRPKERMRPFVNHLTDGILGFILKGVLETETVLFTDTAEGQADQSRILRSGQEELG